MTFKKGGGELIEWRFVHIWVGENKEEVLVVRYDEGFDQSYWIKFGTTIDCTVRKRENPHISGVGSKNYFHEVHIAIERFEEQLEMEKY